MKRLPLYDVHASLGAVFTEYYGWQVPRAYGDVVQEHAAVRSVYGVIDLTPRGKIRVRGNDRASFLHGLLTNDVKKLTVGEGFYAAMLTPTGRTLADMRVFAFADHLLVDTEAYIAVKVRDHFAKYVITEDVTVEDATDALTVIGVHGPQAQRALRHASPPLPSTLKEHCYYTAHVGRADAVIVKASHTGEEGFDIFTSTTHAADVWTTLLKEGEATGAKPVGYDAWNTLRVEAGIPLYGFELDENVIPLEARLEDAISYDKGCYVGQEVIARVKKMNLIQKLLMGFLTESGTPLQRGGKLIFNGEEVGYVTSSVFSPTLKRVIALGYVKRNLGQLGLRLQCQDATGSHTVETTELPFLPSLRR